MLDIVVVRREIVTPPAVGARVILEFADSWRLLFAFIAIDASGVTTEAPPVNG
jgi:hypothetical protein